MASNKPLYAASATITLTAASLATDASRLAGREGNSVDNTVNRYSNVQLSGKITTGTSPTAGKQIDIWLYADDGNDVFPDVIDGTDSNESITSANVLTAGMRLAQSIIVDNTSDRPYYFRDIPVEFFFGGAMPRKWGVFIAHDTGVNLNGTGSNHEFRYTGVNMELV